MSSLALALAALAFSAPVRAQETPFPIPCRQLSQLWTGERGTQYAPRGYHAALGASWPKRELRCDLIDARNFAPLQELEVVSITVARAAYVLDTNNWARSARPFSTSLIPDGFPSGPPESMFNWVRINSTGLVYGGVASGANREEATGRINLGPDNFSKEAVRRGTDGVSLALQLAHEAQHSQGNHVQCSNEPPSAGLNCDTSVMEQFTRIPTRPEGGSHGVGVWYATWIANYSNWPSSYRYLAQNVALMILGCSPDKDYGCMDRFNDKAAADAFACRYFGVHRDGKRACARR